MEIGHEEFITILNEKDEYDKNSEELNKEERKNNNKKKQIYK